jgi:hypothetical protein
MKIFLYNRISRGSLILVLLIFCFGGIDAAKVKKDPFLAGVLSFFGPGLGQFYVQDYATGSLFLLADLLQDAGLVILIVHFSSEYTNEKTGDSVVEWKELNSGEQGIVIGFAIGWIFIKGWAVYDAVISARSYNERYFRKKLRKSSNLFPQNIDLIMALNKDITNNHSIQYGQEKGYKSDVGLSYHF